VAGIALLYFTPADAATACPPDKLVTRNRLTGITLQIFLDGKILNLHARRSSLGWSQKTQKADCDRKLANGSLTR
jgi:hypothetical protein